MAQPTPYSRQASFTTIQQEAPTDPLPGATVDAELNAVKATLDEVLNNLALLQRDDGELANESVGLDQLSDEVALGFNSPVEWRTATAYEEFDTVVRNYKFYIATQDHTSGVFATDLAAGKWRLIVDFLLIGDLFRASSSDSHAVETGTKAFTIESGRYFFAGDSVLIYFDDANYLAGYVTSYSDTNLTVDVRVAVGSGTLASWQIRLAWGVEFVIASEAAATAAAASESAAAISEANAATSAGNAAASESTAAASAAEALQSEQNAAQSEVNTFGTEGRAAAYAASAALSEHAAAASAVAVAAAVANLTDDQIAFRAQVFN